jgi:hypothetical protein
MEAMAGALQAKLLNTSTSFVKLDDRGRPIVPHDPVPLIAQEERHARRARPSEKEAHVVLAEKGLSGGAISQVWSIPTRGSPAARE